MKYKIAHLTTYEYSELVPFCQNELHLAPRNHPGQTCRYHRLIVRPTPASSGKRFDYFGNPVNYFAIQEGHHRLMVSAVSKVDLHPRPHPEPDQTTAWEMVRERLSQDRSVIGLEAYQFCFDSPFIRSSRDLYEYALASFTPERPVLEALLDLTARVYHDFTYDPAATTVRTPLEEVFAMRRGVCQDLAHVQIACLRSLGLAARYVSGYLRTSPPEGKPRLVGADASHAWISLYCGSAGWIDADPTNNCLPFLEHVTVAWGRDYGDVCPIHGLFVGGGNHVMQVAVNMLPLGG